MEVDLPTLVKALSSAFPYLEDEESREKAELVFSFFGFEKRFLDNRLVPAERDFFYQLESLGILKDQREDVQLPENKKEYRLHFWEFDEKGIKKYLEPAMTPPEVCETEDDIYDNDLWAKVAAEKA